MTKLNDRLQAIYQTIYDKTLKGNITLTITLLILFLLVLSQANLALSILSRATYNAQTQWPPTFNPVSYGAIAYETIPHSAAALGTFAHGTVVQDVTTHDATGPTSVTHGAAVSGTTTVDAMTDHPTSPGEIQ